MKKEETTIQRAMNEEKESKEKQEMQQRQEAIATAKALIKSVDVPAAPDEKGRVTPTLLRKMLDLAVISKVFEEFELRLLYLTQRNASRDVRELHSFVTGLLRKLKDIPEQERMKGASRILEYCIMAYSAKELGAQL